MPALRKAKKAKTARALPRKAKGGKNTPALPPEVVTLRKILDAHVSKRDRTASFEDGLQAIASDFFDFARERKQGETKIRVFNPTSQKNGFVSRHTVIMIANDDMPFLVDSTTAALNDMDIGVHMVIHPIISLKRSAKGVFEGFGEARHAPDALLRESWMYIEIDETAEPARLKEIADTLEEVFHNVRLAVEDWQTMRAKVRETMTQLPHNGALGLPAGEREETASFLAWLEADHFTFLGTRDYVVEGRGKNRRLAPDKKSGLGILRDAVSVMFFNDEGEGKQPSDIHLFLERKQLILITKTHKRSVVHRATPMDAVLVKRFDDKGEVVGERLFIGLFTSSFYNNLPNDVPLIRGKLDYVTCQAMLDPRSHDGKALAHILNTFPRDEMFQITQEELFETAMGILQLQERQRLALFVRHDAFSRFVNCLIFVPRERYDSELRKYFQTLLCKTLNGVSAEYNVKITDDSLAQISIVVRTAQGYIPAYDKAALEQEMQDASRGWQGRLQDALVASLGENKGLKLASIYQDAFPDTYCDSVPAHEALTDISFVENVQKTGRLQLHLYQPKGGDGSRLNVKWYNPGHALSLSQIIPMMEDMGLAPDSEHGPHEVMPKNASVGVWVHDCHAHLREKNVRFDMAAIRDKFEECLERIWSGAVEADNYNQLVLLAGLSWREVVILRTIGKYLHQIRLPYSEQAIKTTLATHPKAARLLVDLFIARHDPAQQKTAAKACAQIEKQIFDYLRDVKRVEEDRILRRYVNIIQNTLRTNYFLTGKDGAPKEALSIKLDSPKVDLLPLPKPHVEIFVYSPKVEGIHLRGGKVARGGIRWSDRREDFRTEVLGLMKAQMVKNTVIVPVGSKGGFVVKTTNPPDMAKEGISCYQTYIRAMLDITDNRKGEKIVPPAGVVRHDGDDPYFVVAADKGTAKFSDIANAVSQDYGFWLGDAFASGGSAGYDHKGMGITAKGAWECVKRHFREMGTDIQKEDFTVAGVGDMAGDVFGNGMLLSQHIRLVAAFNHKHIFIDPAPDAAKSFKERQRLFDMPGSQWSDYDKKLISKGGGVYSRDAKTIALSKEACQLLDITEDDLSPDTVMRAILKSQVDLLWFGGIGTYVKAEEESHTDAGDRANDALRINGAEIRAKVIGEGANLGMTQKGRIAYALKGGRLNTDAIDNSAGVDTSDHEVNIKILLGAVMRDGALDLKSRNQLLAKMTADVGKLVLRDNYLQSLALSVAQSRAVELLPQHARLIHQLERSGILNRKVEFLPDDEEIQERLRLGRGLTRPELAVLMGYAKIALYDELVASSLPDNPGLEGDLFLYFPDALQKAYPDHIRAHRLRREIIATFTTNSVINRSGLHFVGMMREKTGRSAADIASAYSLVRDVYALRELWSDVEKLDGKVSAALQIELFTRLGKMTERGTEWYLRNTDLEDTAAITVKHHQAVKALRAWIEKREDRLFSGGGTKEKWQEYRDAGVPETLIKDLLFLPLIALVPEIVTIAEGTKQKLEQVAELYFAIEERFHLQWLRKEAQQMPAENHWQREALGLLVDDYYKVQAGLTRQALMDMAKAKKKPAAKDPGALVQHWLDSRNVAMHDFDVLIAEMAGLPHVHTAQLDLALRSLTPLAAPRSSP